MLRQISISIIRKSRRNVYISGHIWLTKTKIRRCKSLKMDLKWSMRMWHLILSEATKTNNKNKAKRTFSGPDGFTAEF